MPQTFESNIRQTDVTVGVVVARYNESFTTKLLAGTLRSLGEANIDDANVHVVWVPGAFEIPITAKCLAENGDYHVIVCLGVVMRSETPHFDFVAGETARGIMTAGLTTGVPIIFGVQTVDNRDQAIARTLPDNSNRGYIAGQAGLQMADLFRQFD